jgi:hypothetical protein
MINTRRGGVVGFALIVVGILAALLLLPLLIGIWPPDVFTGRRVLVSEGLCADGTKVEVVQYWGGDFYMTEMHITAPGGGPKDVRVLDVDDDKEWSLPISIDERKREIRVTLSGNRDRIEKW